MQESNPFERWKGKKVVVIKRDSFRKFGMLIEVSKDFVVLRYKNGQEEAISVREVERILEDRNGGGEEK